MGEVLIVEPEQSTRTFLADISAGCGFQSYTVATAMEALALLSQIDLPRLIIVAEKMPVMDAGDLLAALERDPRWSAVPAIVCSRSPGSLFTSALAAMGAVVVSHPPSRAELLPHLLALRP
jgi:CheY-like chemotaxis protein